MMNLLSCFKMLAGYCQMSQRSHPGNVSVSAFLCFSGIYICHRDSETQKCSIPSENEKFKLRQRRHPDGYREVAFIPYLCRLKKNRSLILERPFDP